MPSYSRCRRCHQQIRSGIVVKVTTYGSGGGGGDYHENCCRCAKCYGGLKNHEFVGHGGFLYCLRCHRDKFGPRDVDRTAQVRVTTMGGGSAFFQRSGGEPYGSAYGRDPVGPIEESNPANMMGETTPQNRSRRRSKCLWIFFDIICCLGYQ